MGRDLLESKEGSQGQLVQDLQIKVIVRREGERNSNTAIGTFLIGISLDVVNILLNRKEEISTKHK